MNFIEKNPNLNVDLEKQVIINEKTLNWQEDKSFNIQKKIFSKDSNKETALIKISSSSDFSKSKNINSVEIYVLKGVYSNEFGDFEEGTYLKLPKEQESKIKNKDKKAKEECIIFKKTNYPQHQEEQVIIQSKTSSWHQGQGNLEVMPLSLQTALVKWPKNEKFVPHSHWGGEEILVLSGTFIDEHGRYEKGTWLRSPHLSSHKPYVEEETIIFVKTGHM